MQKIKYNEEDLISHHGVAAVIKDENGGILMQKHVKFGFWTIPVGKVKMGQSVEDGLKDEIKEECDINVEDFKEIAFKEYRYTREGRIVSVLSHVFEIQGYSGTIRNSEPQKHSKQLFMPIAKIKRLSYISDVTQLYLEKLGFKREARLPDPRSRAQSPT